MGSVEGKPCESSECQLIDKATPGSEARVATLAWCSFPYNHKGESTMARNCVSVEIYCECEVCGKPLDVNYDVTNLYVTPCANCLEEEHEEAYSKGYNEGQASMEDC